MAHTKAKGTSKLGRDSIAKRLGVKIFGSQTVKAGEVIIRQRGSKFYSGEGTAMGGDDTLYAKRDGKVEFKTAKVTRFSGAKIVKKIVSVK